VAVYEIEGLLKDKYEPTALGYKNRGIVAKSFVTKSEIFDMRFSIDGDHLICGAYQQLLKIKINR